MQNKDNIRVDIRHKFGTFSQDDLTHNSFRIQSLLMSHPKILEAQTIFIYVAKQYEVPTLDMIDMFLGLGKTILVPKIFGPDMKAVEIHDTKKFSKQGFGILEPIQTQEYVGKIDCSVIPGTAFSKDGARIGTGKGYYDKWLSQHQDTYKIGLCYDFQIISEIPQDAWDIKMDEVISS